MFVVIINNTDTSHIPTQYSHDNVKNRCRRFAPRRLTDEHLKLTDGLFNTIEARHTETIGKISSTHEEALAKARETRDSVEAVKASVLETTTTLQNLMESAIESIDIIEVWRN